MNDDEKHVSLADLYDRGLTAKARAEERERCAQVADEEARLWAQDCVADVPEAMQALATAIRELGDE